MKIKKILLTDDEFPKKLRNIAQKPQQLFALGADLKELLGHPAVAIIGSRKITTYGKQVTEQLASELARAGITIISGLALGVDGLAHKAALGAGGKVIAVLPAGVEQVYPATNRPLARQILEQGGALVSEYATGDPAYKANYIARNRIVSGLSDAVLITEAAAKSGTLHTAEFALEQGKEVLAVPGNITSSTSVGTNQLIKTGATMVTSASDVLRALGMEPAKQGRGAAPKGSTPAEQAILDMLTNGQTDGAELLPGSGLSTAQFNQTLTMLELRGHIRPLGNNHWALN